MKAEKRVLIYIMEMGVFCSIMVFGIFYGPQYPQIFFWSIMAAFAAIIAIEIAPTLKDAIILIVGMIVLAIATEMVDKLVNHFFDNTFIKFVMNGVLLAPFYIPVANHFRKMCKKAEIRMKKEEADR